MGFFETVSILLTLAALFSYVNFKYLHLPTTIGVMLISLGASVVILALGAAGLPLGSRVTGIVAGIDFNRAVFHGMLAFLLFAGSLHLDLGDLRREGGVIGLLALVGTPLSTFLIGYASFKIFNALGIEISLIWCMLFGALISPTDPIAVLGIMRKVGAPKTLETQMSGESLFNDGFAVVIFLSILDVVTGEHSLTWHSILRLTFQEVGGGLAVGMLSGLFIYRLLRSVDNYQVEVLLTLALASGGWVLADALHFSAPIAMVIAGLLIGNRGRALAMSETTRRNLDMFWELLDEVLNVVLFMLIGLELLVLPSRSRFYLAGVAAIGIVLTARWISVASLITLLKPSRVFDRGTIRILTWGGLRGGLSVAMALALPQNVQGHDMHFVRDFVLVVTYTVVVFSVFVQGLSAGAVIRRVTREPERIRENEPHQHTSA